MSARQKSSEGTSKSSGNVAAFVDIPPDEPGAAFRNAAHQGKVVCEISHARIVDIVSDTPDVQLSKMMMGRGCIVILVSEANRSRRASPLRQINPSGKISLFPKGKSPLLITPSCPLGRGVGHRHRTLGRDCGGRGGIVREGIAGRDKLRERTWDVQTSGVEAYGKIVWTWRLSGRRQVSRKARRPDRARMSRFPQATEARRARYSGVSAR